MGLSVDIVRCAGAPPSRAEFLRDLAERAGSVGGVEYFGPVEQSVGFPGTLDDHVELRCLLDPWTREYALAVLLARGGVLVDPSTGETRSFVAAPFTERRLADLSWSQRFAIRWRWYSGLRLW